jgi:hypothetical protein
MPSRAAGLLLAALSLLGPAGVARAVETSPTALLAEPERFDGQPVAIRGTVADVREVDATAYTFALDDGTRAVRVLAPGPPACGVGTIAIVDGVFRKEKREGYKIYSEVEATRVACR